MKQFVFILQLIAAGLQSFALEFPVDARQTALGFTAAARTDPFSCFLNPATSAFQTQPAIGISVQNYDGMKDLNSIAFVLGWSSKSSGTFSLGGSQIGNAIFREQLLHVSYAKKLSAKFSAGIQVVNLAYLLQDEKYGNRYLWTIRMGILFVPMNHIRFGVSLFNPNRTYVSKAGDEHIPIVMRIGSEYIFSKKVSWYTDAEKNSTRALLICSGLDYRLTDILSLRAGFSSAPFRFTYGSGLRLKSVTINLSAVYQSMLGFNTAVSIVYEKGGK